MTKKEAAEYWYNKAMDLKVEAAMEEYYLNREHERETEPDFEALREGK